MLKTLAIPMVGVLGVLALGALLLVGASKLLLRHIEAKGHDGL